MAGDEWSPSLFEDDAAAVVSDTTIINSSLTTTAERLPKAPRLTVETADLATEELGLGPTSWVKRLLHAFAEFMPKSLRKWYGDALHRHGHSHSCHGG